MRDDLFDLQRQGRMDDRQRGFAELGIGGADHGDFKYAIEAGDDALDLGGRDVQAAGNRSEEHTSELQSLMRISYAVFFLQQKNTKNKSLTLWKIRRTAVHTPSH